MVKVPILQKMLAALVSFTILTVLGLTASLHEEPPAGHSANPMKVNRQQFERMNKYVNE